MIIACGIMNAANYNGWFQERLAAAEMENEEPETSGGVHFTKYNMNIIIAVPSFLPFPSSNYQNLCTVEQEAHHSTNSFFPEFPLLDSYQLVSQLLQFHSPMPSTTRWYSHNSNPPTKQPHTY